MKANVLENLCIGCGACAALVPDEFDIGDNGTAITINDKVKEENQDIVKEASENCPTGAIKIEE